MYTVWGRDTPLSVILTKGLILVVSGTGWQTVYWTLPPSNWLLSGANASLFVCWFATCYLEQFVPWNKAFPPLETFKRSITLTYLITQRILLTILTNQATTAAFKPYKCLYYYYCSSSSNSILIVWLAVILLLIFYL